MRPLITYFSLAYAISWVIWLPLYGNVLGLPDMGNLPFHHGFGGLGPLIASIITTWIFLKEKGVRLLLKQCIKMKPFIYVVIALFSPFLMVFLASFIIYSMDGRSIDMAGLLTTEEFPDFNIFLFFLYNVIFFGFGEETGWRGFALPRLQSRYNALMSCVILTMFWAIWHWPLFLYRPGYMDMGFAAIAGWFLSLLTGSILLSWLYNSSRGSILVCAIFHATIDIAFTSDLSDPQIINTVGMLVTVWGLLTIFTFKPENLARIRRQKIDFG